MLAFGFFTGADKILYSESVFTASTTVVYARISVIVKANVT